MSFKWLLKSDKTKNVAGHNQGRTRMVDVGFAGRLNTTCIQYNNAISFVRKEDLELSKLPVSLRLSLVRL